MCCQCTCSDVPRRARVIDSCLDYHSRHHWHQALPSLWSSHPDVNVRVFQKSSLMYMPHQENSNRSLLPKMQLFIYSFFFLSVYHMPYTAKQLPYCLKYFHRVRINVENDLELGRIWCLRNYQACV